MPATVDSSSTSCYGKSRNRTLSDSQEEKKIFRTKVDILNCKPEDVKLKMEGNRVIIEGKLFKNSKSKDKPVHFSKHYIMPENCNLDKMRYTITPDGVHITAPRKDREACSDWPKLEDSCTTNCIDLKDRFEIRLNVQEFRPEDIKIKVNGNTITIKAKHLQETGMKRVIKTYSLPDNCEITKLERKFTPQGYLLLTIPKFLGLLYETKNKKKSNNGVTKDTVKCKFNITSEKFEIKIEVTNFKPKDINIIQQKRMVTVVGKRFRKYDNTEEKFEKTFMLPSDYDISRIDRQFHSDGILVISVPRIEGKPIEDFKTFLPENSICDMKIKENYVEIKLNIVGFSPEEIMIKVMGKNTLTLEGKQMNARGRINKSFMKSYILPSECDTKRIKRHITSDGFLIVQVPKTKRTCSLENLAELGNERVFANGNKNGSLDNLSEPDDQAMMNSAELDKEKFEMKFNVQGFRTDDIYVKINKNIVTIECRHPDPGKGIIKSYLVPQAYDSNALQTYITHDDILVVTIPKSNNHNYEPFSDENNNKFSYDTKKPEFEKDTSEKIGDNYTIKVDIRGYNNNDISLDIKGQNIIVQGGHLGNRTISRSFSKNFNVPLSYDVEKLIYYISAAGFLIIEIPKKINVQKNGLSPKSPKLYTFPSGFNGNETTSLADKPDEYILKQPDADVPNGNGKRFMYQEQRKKIEASTYPKEPPQTSPKLKSKNYKSVSDDTDTEITARKINTSIALDNAGNEEFQITVDVTDCIGDDIDVKIKGNNLRVIGKRGYYDGENSDVLQTFLVPEDFNLKEVRTKLEGGMLSIYVPKFKTEKTTKKELSTKGTDILSNVKIGRKNIIIEMDASGLRIEDFEMNTNKNILTIEIMKENSGGLDKFATKVDLPEDSIIDDISKLITPEGKLLVTVPRKFIEVIEEPLPASFSSQVELDENSKFIQAENRRSCLVLSKTNMGDKSKSVKFLVDDFQSESDGSIKFATLPRTVRAKSYNSLNFEKASIDTVDHVVNEKFELKIFVPHHEPDEVIVKVRGSTVTIEGKKKNDRRNTYFSKNFFKTYIVPKNIDASQLKTEFSNDYLVITAPKKE